MLLRKQAFELLSFVVTNRCHVGFVPGAESKQDERKGVQSNDEADHGMLRLSGHRKSAIAIWSELQLAAGRQG